MFNKIMILTTVAALALLVMPGKLDAWGAARVRYAGVGPRGNAYYGSRTVAAGPRGVYSSGRAGAYGYGGAYHAGYRGAAGYGYGYRGGAAYGARYGYVR